MCKIPFYIFNACSMVYVPPFTKEEKKLIKNHKNLIYWEREDYKNRCKIR